MGYALTSESKVGRSLGRVYVLRHTVHTHPFTGASSAGNLERVMLEAHGCAEILRASREHGATEVRVFGSRARGGAPSAGWNRSL